MYSDDIEFLISSFESCDLNYHSQALEITHSDEGATKNIQMGILFEQQDPNESPEAFFEYGDWYEDSIKHSAVYTTSNTADSITSSLTKTKKKKKNKKRKKKKKKKKKKKIYIKSFYITIVKYPKRVCRKSRY